MPGSGGIIINNFGGFSGRMRVKTSGKETDQSRMVDSAANTNWTYDELTAYGFKEGDSCWVSVDIAAGETNHESGDNFNLQKSAPMLTYELRGGIWNPSWSLDG